MSLIPVANLPQVHWYWWCTLTYEYLREFFEKNLKWPQCYFQGLWGRWFMRKKPEAKNIVILPFKSATWQQFYNFVKMPHTWSRLVRWHGISALCTLPFPGSFTTYASLIHLPEPSKPYQMRQLPAQFCPPPFLHLVSGSTSSGVPWGLSLTPYPTYYMKAGSVLDWVHKPAPI